MSVENSMNMLNTSLQGMASTIGAANLDKVNRQFAVEEAEKQRQWNEAMYNKQNAWNYERWLEQNEYNSPVNQIQRLRDAGLNPLNYGLDGSSAGGISAAQPLGYERADYKSQINPIMEGIKGANLAAQTSSTQRLTEKEIELKSKQMDALDADIANKNAGTEGLKLDNAWKDKTLDARVEAENLTNNLTKQQINEAKSRIEVNKQNAHKIEEEAKTEVERRGAVIASRLLSEAQTKEVIEMLPYKKMLTEAQTTAQKAAASAAWAKAAIDKKLLDSGYVEAQVNEITARAEKEISEKLSNEQRKKLEEWKLSIRTGTYFDISECDSVVGRIIQSAGNVLLSTFSQASEIALGGIKL